MVHPYIDPLDTPIMRAAKALKVQSTKLSMITVELVTTVFGPLHPVTIRAEHELRDVMSPNKHG